MPYEPMDMSDYPYKAGDKLPGGIEVMQIIKGTSEDSFAGYEYREKIYNHKKGTFALSETPFIVKRGTDHESVDERGRLCSNDYQLIGPVGNPLAQGVWFKGPENKDAQFVRPKQFLELVRKAGPQDKSKGKDGVV